MSSHADTVLIDEIVPRLRHLIPHKVSFVGAEDAEEVLQDATLMAARLLARARANGKQVTPGNIAFYTLLHLRCGRRSHSASASDAMGTRTQIVGNSRVTSLAAPIPFEEQSLDEPMTLADVLASDAEDPSETAARNLDWQALVASLDERASWVAKRNFSPIHSSLAVNHWVRVTTPESSSPARRQTTPWATTGTGLCRSEQNRTSRSPGSRRDLMRSQRWNVAPVSVPRAASSVSTSASLTTSSKCLVPLMPGNTSQHTMQKPSLIRRVIAVMSTPQWMQVDLRCMADGINEMPNMKTAFRIMARRFSWHGAGASQRNQPPQLLYRLEGTSGIARASLIFESASRFHVADWEGNCAASAAWPNSKQSSKLNPAAYCSTSTLAAFSDSA